MDKKKLVQIFQSGVVKCKSRASRPYKNDFDSIKKQYDKEQWGMTYEDARKDWGEYTRNISDDEFKQLHEIDMSDDAEVNLWIMARNKKNIDRKHLNYIKQRDAKSKAKKANGTNINNKRETGSLAQYDNKLKTGSLVIEEDKHQSHVSNHSKQNDLDNCPFNLDNIGVSNTAIGSSGSGFCSGGPPMGASSSGGGGSGAFGNVKDKKPPSYTKKSNNKADIECPSNESFDMFGIASFKSQKYYPEHKKITQANYRLPEHNSFEQKCDDIELEFIIQSSFAKPNNKKNRIEKGKENINKRKKNKKNWSKRSKMNKEIEEEKERRERRAAMAPPITPVFDQTEPNLDIPSPKRDNGYTKTTSRGDMTQINVTSQFNNSSSFYSK